MAEFQPSTPPTRLREFQPSTPVMALPRRTETSPPPLPHMGRSLQSALRSGHVSNMVDLLLEDVTLVHVPVATVVGFEPLLVAAVRVSCSVSVLKVLLRHGAMATAHGCDGASALHVLVSSLQLASGPAERPTWSSLQTVPWVGCPVAHQGQPQNGIAAAWPPFFVRNAQQHAERHTEQHACALAACLLHYGADANEEWKGVLPADTARQSGHQCLADLIEHFAWWHAQPVLAKHRSTASGIETSGSPLLACNAALYGLICDFVAPPCWGIISRQRCAANVL